jgi:hypothetical protein
MRLEDPTLEPGFEDTRNSLVVWARPPDHVLRLAGRVQEMLREAAPSEFFFLFRALPVPTTFDAYRHTKRTKRRGD